jgi:UDP-N-acetylmuramyl pentapeptide phosphotransferase/UDP-N-acetylglucosamine-1-phosphate transferase
MLGDAGANALGAVLGVAVITRLRSRTMRGIVLAGLITLTAASERVSFSEVIDRSPTLGRLDQLGRLP